MFQVVPEQLQVSDGWVRCGQCDEVFDANAQLQAPIEPLAIAETAWPVSAAQHPRPTNTYLERRRRHGTRRRRASWTPWRPRPLRQRAQAIHFGP